MNDNPFVDWIDYLPAPPPWRRRNYVDPKVETPAIPQLPISQEILARHYVPTQRSVAEMREAVILRRPLLLFGNVQGPWQMACYLSWSLGLGSVLRCSVTRNTKVQNALYHFDRDAMERNLTINPSTLQGSIADYIQLGPLGTALLPSSRPRVIVIEEVDQGNEAFGNELARLLSGPGSFRIPELITELRINNVAHRLAICDSDAMVLVENGMVDCLEPPVVIMSATSPSAVNRSLFELSIAVQEILNHSILETIIRRWFPLEWEEPGFHGVARKAIDRLLLSKQFGYNLSIGTLLDEIYLDHIEGRPRKFLPRAFQNAPSAFLSYRRSDSSAKALILKVQELCLNAGFKSVFVDVQRDSIPLGRNYVDLIQEAIETVDVFFVVIGDQWARILDERRNDIHDPVAWEIEIALRRGKEFEQRIIPLMLQSTMPPESQLPDRIRNLHYLNGIRVDDLLSIDEELLPSLRALLLQVEKSKN